MTCIEMPELAYLYGNLLISAQENTPECGPSLVYFAVTYARRPQQTTPTETSPRLAKSRPCAQLESTLPRTEQ